MVQTAILIFPITFLNRSVKRSHRFIKHHTHSDEHIENTACQIRDECDRYFLVYYWEKQRPEYHA